MNDEPKEKTPDKEEVETPNDQEQGQLEGKGESQSYVLAQFVGPGSSGFLLSIHNVDPWQLTALSVELADRAQKGREMNRRKQLKDVAMRNAEMLNAKKLTSKKTDD